MRPVARRVKPRRLASRKNDPQSERSLAATSVLDRVQAEAEFSLPQSVDRPNHSFADYSADEMAYPAISAFAPDMYFRVDLDVFRGPLDLLLYLVRKHELEITEIPISLITNQFLEHMQVLEQLDARGVQEYLRPARTFDNVDFRRLRESHAQEALLAGVGAFV